MGSLFCSQVGTPAHEIGHALGFFHTQSRHDRDDFITETNNIDSYEHKDMILGRLVARFTKQSQRFNYNYNLTYDYGSVMHYGTTGCASTNCQMFQLKTTMKLQTFQLQCL
uniref:Metalloendopeptidase n=1 Tax=Angiostrongylus cantonensis TaxID=6313 RepID=A0A0K0DQ25_ANGCA